MPEGNRVRHRHILAIGLMAALGGCSLWNPHVTWERPSITAGGTATEKPYNEITISDAIAYANRGKEAYKQAAGEQEELKSALALGLIPLSAAAVGLGVHEVSGEAITALGLTGAAGLGLGTWFNNEPYKTIYIAGAKALGCAVEAVAPLDLNRSLIEQLRIDLGDIPDAAGLNDHMSALHTARGAAESALRAFDPNGTDTGPLVERAEDDIDAAADLLALADQTYRSARALERRIAGGGPLLMEAVDRIAAEVDEALIANAPDLSALPEIINGLSQNAQVFGLEVESGEDADTPGGGAAMAAPTEDAVGFLPLAPTPEARLENALENLKRAAETLLSSNRRVAILVESIQDRAPGDALQDCGVDVEQLNLAISVLPDDEITFPSNADGKGRLVLTGGKRPYFAVPTKDMGDRLRVTPREEPGLSLLLIETESGLPADTYKVHVFDSARGTAEVEIKIE